MPKTEEESKLLILTPDGITWLTQLGLGNQKFDTIEVREDVQPVKHGKNLKEEYPTLFQRSVCGCEDWDTSEVNYGEYNYCPNCGAKMDGAE